MTEFELKLEVPQDSREQVVMAFGKARRQRLQARYFDTDEQALAQAHVVVRVRKEGSRWVQTAKAPSSSSLERLEHNVALPRPAAGAMPAVDLSRHAGTPLEAKLRSALDLQPGEPFPALSLVFETDVQRQVMDVKSGRSMVEVAFDRGRVAAGDRHAALCEVEFELKSGRPQDAVRLAQAWCIRHGLWISSVSKSAKGLRLAENSAPMATTAQPVRMEAKAGIREAMAAMVLNCMDQVLPNASDIAGGSTDREQVHQLRIGLRRLRCVLRELGATVSGANAQWEPQLAAVFRVLGVHRDSEFLSLQMQPQLVAAGGPTLEAASAAGQPDPGQAVRSAAFQRTLLDILGFAHSVVPGAADGGKPARQVVRARLGTLYRQVAKEGRSFLSLEEARQHRLRKRLKRLRYLAEMSRPLFKGRQVDRFLKKLKPLQDSLGLYNDRLMALHAYQELAQTDARAWFGIGWLSANRQDDAASCQRDLQALGKLDVFW